MQYVSEASRGIYGPALNTSEDASPIDLALSSLLASRSEKDHGEGLRRLLGRLQASGYGAIADTWVQTGASQSILPNQLEEALGPATIHALSLRSGLPSQELLMELCRRLPNVVDTLTPTGQVPDPLEMINW